MLINDHCLYKNCIFVLCFRVLVRMASAEAIAKLETKAVAAERLIELLRQQISQVDLQVRSRCLRLYSCQL